MVNMASSNVHIIFEPYGKTAKALIGATILQVAKELGINIRSECGGSGSCGKCKVIIDVPTNVSNLTDAERKHLTTAEIGEGYRLACQTRIIGNLRVMVPPESLLESRRIQTVGVEKKVVVNPPLKKFYLILPKPTLNDAKPDLERLLDALTSFMTSTGKLEIDHGLLTELSEILRRAYWNVTVIVWDERKIIAMEAGDTINHAFGFAVDVGTSKIAGHLVDLTTGETVAIESIENPQSIYGEDVMTRITFASSSDTNLKTLQKLAVDGINRILNTACNKAHVKPEMVYEVVVAGNTAMHHLLSGIQPKYLGLAPYTPVLKRSLNINAKTLCIKVHRGGIVTFLPVIGGFVGADAVADILATGMDECEELSLLVDIGTNTEIILGNKDDMLCCSCASGPAFEGAHIKYGMKAVTGAIEKVRVHQNFEVEYETIGGVKPMGLCGSAVIDAIAEMLKNKVIDERGTFKPDVKTKRIRRENKNLEFVIAWSEETAIGREITVTQKDIREIQLAKAAIQTGCTILMKRKNIKKQRIKRIFIAGAFGSYLNSENARVIGLVPDIPVKRIKFVGNTSVMGAKMALISKEIREKADLISKKVRYLELANDPDFSRQFLASTLLKGKN
jgi:uncharacterized 2Fe-2S/4Fe-4S cluster protein (DUF4445 family)